MLWVLGSALAGPASSVDLFPGDEGARRAEEYVWSVATDHCFGSGVVAVTADVRGERHHSVEATPPDSCLIEAIEKTPPTDLPDGTYSFSFDFDFDPESSGAVMMLIGTTGDSSGGTVEDLFADEDFSLELALAEAEARGDIVAGVPDPSRPPTGTPSIRVVEGPDGIEFPSSLATDCDGKRGSNETSTLTLTYLEGQATQVETMPPTEFAVCVGDALKSERKGALNAEVVLEVVGSH